MPRKPGINYKFLKGEFSLAMEEIYFPIARAGTNALVEAGDMAKRKGRQNIAAAGFSKKWQNALRAEVYPIPPGAKKKRYKARGKVSASAALFIYHAIPYSEIFEDGAKIRGNPKLWLPMKGVAKRVAGEKMTPRLFEKKVGPLFSIPSKNPRVALLAANLAVSKTAAKKGKHYRRTMPALRKGAAGQGIIRAVPVFVGVDAVQIGQKFKIRPAIFEAADKIPALYLKHLSEDSDA